MESVIHPVLPAHTHVTEEVFDGDDFDKIPFLQRVSKLATSWNNVVTKLGQHSVVKLLHRATLLLVLQEEWRKLSAEATAPLRSALEGCVSALTNSGGNGNVLKKMKSLLSIARDPWYHPVLKRLMSGESPPEKDFKCWLREEGYVGAVERLRQLCSAGGSCCRAASILSESLLSVDSPSPPPFVKKVAVDACLVLLLRAGKTKECLSHFEKLDTNEAVAVIGRLSMRNKTNGRIWKHARDTALLCAQVLVAASLVRPLDIDSLGTLAAQLTSLYSSCPDELPPTLRKLLQSAETAHHIYILCRAVQNKFGDTMQQFVCELYIRALTTGINELERLKLQDEQSESASAASHRLASWFLALGEYLSKNPFVSAECTLTAFSLHPSRYYYRKVEDSSVVVKKSEKKKVDPSVYIQEDLDAIVSQLQSSCTNETRENIVNNKSSSTKNILDLNLSDKQQTNESIAPNLISSAVLEGENLSLGSDMCHDLAVLLSGPRLKLLTWDLSWKELSTNCLSYMADTNEGTKTLTKELKYVHLDYSKWTPQNDEERDIYYGIEKGYEHHLEIEDDDDDWEEYSYDYEDSNALDVHRKEKNLKKKSSENASADYSNKSNKHGFEEARNINKPSSSISNDSIMYNKSHIHLSNTNLQASTSEMSNIFEEHKNHCVKQEPTSAVYKYHQSQMESFNEIGKRKDLELISNKNVTKPSIFAYEMKSNNLPTSNNDFTEKDEIRENMFLPYNYDEQMCQKTQIQNNNRFSYFASPNTIQRKSSNCSNSTLHSNELGVLKFGIDNTLSAHKKNIQFSNSSVKQENSSVQRSNTQPFNGASKNMYFAPKRSTNCNIHLNNGNNPNLLHNASKESIKNSYRGFQFTNIKINNPMGLCIDQIKSSKVNKRTNLADKKEALRNKILNKQKSQSSNVSNKNSRNINALNEFSSCDKNALQCTQTNMKKNEDTSLKEFITELHASVNAGSKIVLPKTTTTTTSNIPKKPESKVSSLLSYRKPSVLKHALKTQPTENVSLLKDQPKNQNVSLNISKSDNLLSPNFDTSHQTFKTLTPQTYSRKHYSNIAKKTSEMQTKEVSNNTFFNSYEPSRSKVKNTTNNISNLQKPETPAIFEDIEQFGIQAHTIQIRRSPNKPERVECKSDIKTNIAHKDYSRLSKNIKPICSQYNDDFEQFYAGHVFQMTEFKDEDDTDNNSSSLLHQTSIPATRTESCIISTEYEMHSDFITKTLEKENHENKTESFTNILNESCGLIQDSQIGLSINEKEIDSPGQLSTQDSKNDADSNLIMEILNEPTFNVPEFLEKVLNSEQDTIIPNTNIFDCEDKSLTLEKSLSNLMDDQHLYIEKKEDSNDIFKLYPDAQFLDELKLPEDISNDMIQEISEIKCSEINSDEVPEMQQSIDNKSDDVEKHCEIITEKTNLNFENSVNSNAMTNIAESDLFNKSIIEEIVQSCTILTKQHCDQSIEDDVNFSEPIIENNIYFNTQEVIEESKKSLVEKSNHIQQEPSIKSNEDISVSKEDQKWINAYIKYTMLDKHNNNKGVDDGIKSNIKINDKIQLDSPTSSTISTLPIKLDNNEELLDTIETNSNINEHIPIDTSISSTIKTIPSKPNNNEEVAIVESNSNVNENIQIDSQNCPTIKLIPENSTVKQNENSSNDKLLVNSELTQERKDLVDSVGEDKDKSLIKTDHPETVVKDEIYDSQEISKDLTENPDKDKSLIKTDHPETVIKDEIYDSQEISKDLTENPDKDKSLIKTDHPETVIKDEIDDSQEILIDLTENLDANSSSPENICSKKCDSSTDIIDLISDNSDDDIIEVPVEDPIAISNEDINVLSNVKKPIKRKRKVTSKPKKSLMIVVDDPISNKIIKVKSIDFADQLKLQMVCRVKLHDINTDNCEQAQSHREIYDAQFRSMNNKTERTSRKNIKTIKSKINARSSNTNKMSQIISSKIAKSNLFKNRNVNRMQKKQVISETRSKELTNNSIEKRKSTLIKNQQSIDSSTNKGKLSLIKNHLPNKTKTNLNIHKKHLIENIDSPQSCLSAKKRILISKRLNIIISRTKSIPTVNQKKCSNLPLSNIKATERKQNLRKMKNLKTSNSAKDENHHNIPKKSISEIIESISSDSESPLTNEFLKSKDCPIKTYERRNPGVKNENTDFKLAEYSKMKEDNNLDIDLPDIAVDKTLELPDSQCMSVKNLLSHDFVDDIENQSLNDDVENTNITDDDIDDLNQNTDVVIVDSNIIKDNIPSLTDGNLIDGIALFQTNFPHLDYDSKDNSDGGLNQILNNLDYLIDVKDFDKESDREKLKLIGNHMQMSAASLSDLVNVRLPRENLQKNISIDNDTEINFKNMHLVSMIQAEIENLFNNNMLKNDDKQLVLAELKNLKNNVKSEVCLVKTSKNALDFLAQVRNICKKFQKELPIYKNVFSRIPGVDDSDHFVPPPSSPIVQVIQIGQMPMNSSQQCPTTAPTPSSEYSDTTTTTNNSEDSSSPNHESKTESTDEDIKDHSSDEIPEKLNKIKEENNDEKLSEVKSEIKPSENNMVTDSTQNSEQSQSTNISDRSVQLIFAPQTSRLNVTNVNNMDSAKDLASESSDNSVNFTSTSNQSIVSGNRAQTLMNLLSQKLIHPPTSLSNQSIQMATFSKGTPINALSLQQALAQILPPPLSQASNDNSGQSTTPQVVHIVQGKSTNQSGTAFSGLLVDNSQSSIVNNGNQTTQVLHIVQGKNNNPNQSVIGQANVNNFSGLSIVESGSQQAGNQVLHIVNTQNKNNATAQLLKRVNLLTSISNSQGNNEQKMVQFVCKAADGKTIQLNTQPQRGMVLRLQPIDNSNNAQQKNNESITASSMSVVQNTIKKSPQNESTQQEIKSRSVYEENYAKFIQNSSNKLSPMSPDKSTSLPKFNQAFGKTVFQENTNLPKSTDTPESSQISNVNSESQSNQDLASTINLNQISSPPLLIRKAQNATNQNIQQVKQNLTPVNIQTMHGGVIYTRQIPVNIGGNQTINLITVPSSDLLDENQLQNIKQAQEKISAEQSNEQIIKIVPQDSSLADNSNEESSNQQYNDQNHPLLTQMRIKVPMLGKSGPQMVTGTRVVRPVLQIQRNMIPGSNSAVYQQLVLTTAPAVRQINPGVQQNIKSGQPSNSSQQESNLSTSTLEQLREFDMVLEQVKERSTVQPAGNSATFPESSQCQIESTSDTNPSNNTSNNTLTPNQREVLYSIGPNQTVNVTYVNQKILTNTPTVLATSYVPNTEANTISNNTGIAHNISVQSKSGSSTPNKVITKPMKTKPTKPATVATTTAAKTNPIVPKTSIQKPLEDEQTTQRILYILAEYKEQVENSPDKDKPAPRRRSNPPTNPSSSSKRKKGSSGSSKKGGSQSVQEMSPLGAEEGGHTMGSEDSSCGLSQGECGENSIQGLESQSPQGSPQKTARKILFSNSDIETSTTSTTSQTQQRNLIIADGQTITMTRPGTNKTTALLMPANYLLPMSMMKGGQQIAIVTNQGPKILSVPHGEGNTTNTLFLQRLISPTGLKPMIARPNQVRQVRLPANTMQAFSLTPAANISNDNWNLSNNSSQPKFVMECNTQNQTVDDIGTIIKTEIKEEIDSPNESINSTQLSESNISTSTDEKHANNKNPSELAQHTTTLKEITNPTMNLIQLHSLSSDDPGKIFAVQNSATLNSLIQIAGKNNIHGISTVNLQDIRKPQEMTENVMLIRKSQFDDQFSLQEGGISDEEMKTLPELELQHEDAAIKRSPTPNRNFVLSHSSQVRDSANQEQTQNNTSWSLSSNANHATAVSPSYGSYSNSPGLVHQVENQDPEMQEAIVNRKGGNDDGNRILQHQYSPVSSPGPRHLYNKIFISSSSANTSAMEEKELSQARGNTTPHAESGPGTSASHSTASFRHKFAIMEHELRLQKSLSEECEDLGVDSPSASDLFPEAELLFAASPSQFEQSQDSTGVNSNQILSSSLTQPNQSSNTILFSHMTKEPKISEDRIPDMVEESEFARMHPNTTFHSGEIEFGGEEADDTAINIPFRLSKQTISQPVNVKKTEIIKSVIEGVGNSGSSRTFSNTKLVTQFPTLNPNIKRNVTIPSVMQSSDENSEGTEDSLNSPKGKNDNFKRKRSSNLFKKDLKKIHLSSNMPTAIQKNTTQVICHSSVEDGSSTNDRLIKKSEDEVINQNGQKFSLENHNLQSTNSRILKSMTVEKDVQDRLTCSSPEQHSELFWESNSNSNQSAESIPNQVTSLLDFSSEDSNKCCKSPMSCDETNSTDSSIGLHNIRDHKEHSSRISSVIKTSGGTSSAADGPILHSALTSSLPSLINHDIVRKTMPQMSDSNMSSPEPDLLDDHKHSAMNPLTCQVLSPTSLTTEINLGVDIETSSSEETGTKQNSENLPHSGSSTPEEGTGSGRIRRTSLRGSGGVKKSCHCCSGEDTPNPIASQSTSQGTRRPRRKPSAPTH